jgi:hypothetical protein
VAAAVRILETLRTLGVTVTVIGPDRLRLEPASLIPQDLVSRIREEKPAILEALRKRPATCGPTCYELEPGRWIHHPWNGCVTAASPKPVAIAQADCRHCDGKGECACAACNLRRTSEPAPCCSCQNADHQAWVTETMEQTCWHCDGKGACKCIECGQYKARMEWAAGPCRFCEARKPHPVQ